VALILRIFKQFTLGGASHKKILTSLAFVLIFLGTLATANATLIKIDGLDGYTAVRFAYPEGTEHYVYAGEFQLTLDEKYESVGYCVDLFTNTYIPSGPFETELKALTEKWQMQAAWLMEYSNAETNERKPLYSWPSGMSNTASV
jgi:hypothetical protein